MSRPVPTILTILALLLAACAAWAILTMPMEAMR